MPFQFDPPGTSALRQGELLENVWWHRPIWPASPIPEGTAIAVEPVQHTLVLVLHQDCDLERDFDLRARAKEAGREPDQGNGKLLPQVLCCDAYLEGDIRVRVTGASMERVKQNQVERFHYFPDTSVTRIAGEDRIAVYLDFCAVFSVFTAGLYEAIERRTVHRCGIVPPVYLQDLTHRAFGYLSRVALP